MKSYRLIKVLVVVLLISYAGNAFSKSEPELSVSSETLKQDSLNDIPFKSEDSSYNKILSLVMVLVTFFLISALTVTYLKKKNIIKVINFDSGKLIKVIEITRISPKSTGILLEVKGNDLLLVQNENGTNIVVLDKASNI